MIVSKLIETIKRRQITYSHYVCICRWKCWWKISLELGFARKCNIKPIKWIFKQTSASLMHIFVQFVSRKRGLFSSGIRLSLHQIPIIRLRGFHGFIPSSSFVRQTIDVGNWFAFSSILLLYLKMFTISCSRKLNLSPAQSPNPMQTSHNRWTQSFFL